MVTAHRQPGPLPAHRPSAIILGGENGIALSIARSLGRRGVDVYLLARPDCLDRHSRYVRHIHLTDDDSSPESAWSGFLLGNHSQHLRGSVLIAASDIALELIIEHRQALSSRYLLDLCNPEAQKLMLNKLYTYRKSREVGILTPRFWEVGNHGDVESHRDEYVYPLIVKPIFSHKFVRVFRYGKYIMVNDISELMDACSRVWEHDINVMLVELIPGPDSLLCSYYTYIDERGDTLFDFTKRVIRRYPISYGVGCYHVTDHIPELRNLALELFRSVGLMGVANIEFKYDERDGTLKIIECNARFTAANRLVEAAGFDLAWLVYSRAIGCFRPFGRREYRQGLRLLRPGWDFLAYLALRAQGELAFASWVRSIMHPQLFQYFSWTDPAPWIASMPRLPGRLFRYLQHS